MNDIRLQATVIIWSAVAAILIFGTSSDDLIPMTFILGIAATITTAVIWEEASKTMRANQEQQAEQAKNKRNNHTSRLVDNLNEDEILELEDLLTARREDRLIDR